MTAAIWIALLLVVILFLVGLAYLLGRGLWGLIQPRDADPGGKRSPPPELDPNIWTGTPFVDYLRLGRKLRKHYGRRGRKTGP